MDQISKGSSTELLPYERGVSLREVLRGTLRRFLPGSLIGMGGLAIALGFSSPAGWIGTTAGVVVYSAVLTLGYGLGMAGLRRWLYPDAKVDGRRSVVAGFVAPLAMFIGATMGRGLTSVQMVPFLALVGLLLAFGVFFAWLSPTPEAMRSPEFAPDRAERYRVGTGDATLLSGQ